jgi:hypothetical protein
MSGSGRGVQSGNDDDCVADGQTDITTVPVSVTIMGTAMALAAGSVPVMTSNLIHA